MKEPLRKKWILSAVLALLIGFTWFMGPCRAWAQAVPGTAESSFRLRLAELPVNGKQAAAYWAETLAQRNGQFRFALLSDDLKQKEYSKYKNDYNWVIGGSSPWVTGYTVSEKGGTDAGTVYRIDYVFSDSTRTKYVGSETIAVKQFGQIWLVTQHENLDYGFPDLKECKGPFQQITPMANELPTKSAKDVAALWAESLETRSGAFRFALLDTSDNNPQNAESESYRKANWCIGASSPWIVGYSVNPIDQRTPGFEQYQVDYKLTDSAGIVYKSTEFITLKYYGDSQGGLWQVEKHDGAKPIRHI